MVYDSGKPLFVNAASGNYRLTVGSLAINVGSNALIPSDIITDLDGNARIVNGIVDIGAYEYDSTIPINLRSTGKTEDSVTLTWDTVLGTTSYEIQWRIGNGNWTNVPDVTGTSTTISNLTASTEYQFQILAINVNGKSGWSASVPVTTLGKPPEIIITQSTGNKTTVKGVKLDKKDAKPTQTSLTLNMKAASFAAHTSTDEIWLEIFAPRAKGQKADNINNLVASVKVDLVALRADGIWEGASGNLTVKVTQGTNGIAILVTGLNSGTKYTVRMQAFDGSKYSKVTKVSASTAKYNAVTNNKTVTKQTVVGQVTLGWNDAKNMPKGESYEVGFWIGKVAIFNKQDYDALIASSAKQKDKDTAKAIWTQIGERIGSGLATDETKVTFYGVTQKITFAIRATAEVVGTQAQSAVAKIAVTPLKYPAPATLTQSAPGVMTLNWTAPKLKNVTLPDVSALEVTSITYTIGLYETKQKKFTTTTATTFIEDIEGLTTDALTGVSAGNTIAIQQVIKFANGNVVLSAVKTLKIK